MPAARGSGGSCQRFEIDELSGIPATERNSYTNRAFVRSIDNIET
jgi:hypothetical protein